MRNSRETWTVVVGAIAIGLIVTWVVVSSRENAGSLPRWNDSVRQGNFHSRTGTLYREGECLYLDGETRMLPIFPRSLSSWDESRGVLKYSGLEYEPGDRLTLSGGQIDPEAVDWSKVRPQPDSECDRTWAFIAGQPKRVGDRFILPLYEGRRPEDTYLAGELKADIACLYLNTAEGRYLLIWPEDTTWNAEERYLQFRGERFRVDGAIRVSGSMYEGKVWLNEDLKQMPATDCDTSRTFMAVEPE